MKNTAKNQVICAILAIAIAVASLLSLSGCLYSSGEGATDAYINERGELVIGYSDGREQNLGVISTNETTVNIEAAEGDASAAAQAGLVSAVTVTANFKKTVNNSYGGMFPGFGGGGGSTTSEYSSEGSGVIYKIDRDSGSAFIVTNYHVVYDSASNSKDGISEDIEIYLYGMEYEGYAISAEYVGGSLYYDIAVLYVENCEALKNSVYNSAKVTDSDGVAVGQTAIAIGNPEGYGISASLGIVSVNSEYITMTAADEVTTVSFRVMRVDTAVNSGNSGGGLYNDRSELIGIVNAKIIDQTVENIAYAIPANVAFAVADNIIDNCFEKDNRTVMRAVLGVTLGVTESWAEMDTELGILTIREKVGVTEVSRGSIGEGIIEVGDIIKSITVGGETKQVTRRYHIIDEMLNARMGDTVTVTVERDGKEISLDIVITKDCILAY